MAVVNSTNYSALSPIMQWATADSDIFNRTHVANTAQTVEAHVHSGAAQGGGLSVLNINSSASTNTALAHAGDALITASKFTYKDGSGNTHTLANLDSSTFTGTLIVPVSAGASPTVSGTIAYDSTANTFVVGVNGSTQTLISTGGSAVGVASGGTGRATLTAHSVIVGEGTSAVGMIGPGTTNTLLHGNTGSDPSFSQVTGSDIASATITASNLAAGACSGAALNLEGVDASGTLLSTAQGSYGVIATATGLDTGASYLVTACGYLLPTGGITSYDMALGPGTNPANITIAREVKGGSTSADGSITGIVATGAGTSISFFGECNGGANFSANGLMSCIRVA